MTCLTDDAENRRQFESWWRETMNTTVMDLHRFCHGYACHETNRGWMSWNACRAAMLAAAPHDNPALNSLQSVDSVAGKWIPVSERMPENDVSVLTFDGMYKRVHHAMYGHWQCWEPEKITHWTPLPASPQEVKP